MSLNINHKEPKNWRELQLFVSEILNECGYVTQIEKTIQTLRGKVEIDVYAEKEEGIKTIILCECKFWKNNIPQTVVHSLRSVINDYGATNGFIISKVGFQSGAIETIDKSNISLLTWSDFQELFLSKWLDNIIERNHKIGRELLPFTTGMGFFYDIYQTLDEEKQKSINSVIKSYSRFEIFSQKDLYYDFNENKISINNIDEIISEIKLKLPVKIQSYQDYFNFIYKYCDEALTKIDLIIGERIRKIY
ncbi:restriction endonuclease [Flavobacterium aestuarii]|uniref:restriction endonuclease n=1 Tax=Flavobacterium aestuarii TaxID=3149227 RepID=UPI0032B4314F